MLEANAIFTLDGVSLQIQCSPNDTLKDICQKYANKIKRNINSLVFLYGGSQLNFNLKFKDAITDKESNEMKILAYLNETDEFICPKCGEKIKLNTEKIDDIILSINNLKETIDSAKIMLENVIEKSSVNIINVQLKGINIIINTLIEDIKKSKEKVKNLLKENNYIIGEINIGENEMNKNIRILNSYEECLRTEPHTVFKDEKYKNENEIKKCEIQINDKLIPFNYFYNFKSKGKYIIKYSFKNTLKNIGFMFRGCSSLININLSQFNANNVIDMHSMFDRCSCLKNIYFSSFNTKNVINMIGIFYGCSSLINIDLSNFNTNKVSDMRYMFYGCSSLINIDLSNFNTNNVTNMNRMFFGCSSLTNIDLSNFNTNNVTHMYGMFYECSSLTNINIYNFSTNNVIEMRYMFGKCESLNKNNIIIKDRKILDKKNLF